MANLVFDHREDCRYIILDLQIFLMFHGDKATWHQWRPDACEIAPHESRLNSQTLASSVRFQLNDCTRLSKSTANCTTEGALV
jgi:hypothetical protein